MLERTEEVNEGIADLEVLTKFSIFDNDRTLHNLKRSVVTVNMDMAHVNTKEIAELEGEAIHTIQNDAKQAKEDLTALISVWKGF